MKIAARELEALAKSIFKRTSEGAIKQDKEDGFIAWGMEMLESLKGPKFGSDAIELPPQFIPLYRELQKSADYKIDLDSVLLQEEQKRTDSPYIARTSTPVTAKRMNDNFLETFSQLTGASKGAFEHIESARRSGSDGEMKLAVRAAFTALVMERRASYADPIEKFLTQHPEQRLLWSGIGRRMGGGQPTPEEASVMKNMKAWVPGDSLGSGMFPIPVNPDVWDLLLTYSAFRDLGVRPMQGQYTKFAQVTALPDAYVLSPANQGTGAPPVDASLAGQALSEASNTFVVLLQISLAWLQDPKLDVASAVLSRVIPGLDSASCGQAEHPCT
jgi:hypothetical protein